jgi:L-ascorbate metabolism protein UlaG (beta-lactamase superfamily)
MRKVILILVLFGSVLLQGCGILRITMSNMVDSVTDEPKYVHKIKDPLKDSVKISVLWAGHSTSLVRIYDKVLLLDPIMNKRFGGLILRRTEFGLDLDALNKLDYIFISHTHIDHLSFGTLSYLEEKFPKATLVFPKGAEYYLPDYDFKMIRVDNYESQYVDYIGNPVVIDGMKVTPVYALHTGGRYGFDVYSWREQGATGYIIEYKDVVFYYAGDTGYEKNAFKKIGSKFNIDVAVVPVGPCRNCDSTGFWHHTSSIEALDLLRDIKAHFMIPVHYGASRYISDENRPRDMLIDLLETTAYSDLKDRVKILNVGEQIIWKKPEEIPSGY